jgi:uroporphyrin-III C-methyltransferase / precorrin-2 dehydrogenase / sirohydrochlorin ferrochelatase
VVLVGGGPGDPELLTLRGYRAIMAADVVVTDRLGPRALLSELDPSVSVIEVGKTPRLPSTSQDDINALLIDQARNGSLVVRLKGGDPFVFGRGAEEVLACASAGIAVEVVPGVSTVTAAAVLAGIPLTHRGITQEVIVASGHVPPNDPRSTVDWPALATSNATLVLLMAVENLTPIAASLISAGRSPGTPVATVQDASLPTQLVHRLTLQQAAENAPRHLRPPAVVVVGEVVSLLDLALSPRPSPPVGQRAHT